MSYQRDPKVAVAEKLRVAGRLIDEVAQAMLTGEVAAEQEIRVAAAALNKDAAALWGAVAGRIAGREYIASVVQPVDEQVRAAKDLGEIVYHAAKINGSELVKVVTTPDFFHREEARCVVELRAVTHFASGPELEWLLQQNEPRDA